MKFFVASLVVLCAIAAVLAVDDWETFKKKNGKTYFSSTREAKAKAAYNKHKAKIEELEKKYAAGEITYKPAAFKFHDLPTEEIRNRYMGKKDTDGDGDIDDDDDDEVSTRASTTTYARIYDTRNIDKIKFPAVRDQGNDCSSDWAFAAIAAIEINYAKTALDSAEEIDLSEQQLVDCALKDNKKDKDGCNGGTIAEAYKYLLDNGGSPTETDYPYTGLYGTCVTGKTAKATISKYTKLKSSDNDIKDAIIEYGSIPVAVDADEWLYYSTGVLKMEKPGSANHYANVIGWGWDEKASAKYWLIRNSWGDTWGDKGYIRVAQDKRNTMKKTDLYGVVSAVAAAAS